MTPSRVKRTKPGINHDSPPHRSLRSRKSLGLFLRVLCFCLSCWLVSVRVARSIKIHSISNLSCSVPTCRGAGGCQTVFKFIFNLKLGPEVGATVRPEAWRTAAARSAPVAGEDWEFYTLNARPEMRTSGGDTGITAPFSPCSLQIEPAATRAHTVSHRYNETCASQQPSEQARVSPIRKHSRNWAVCHALTGSDAGDAAPPAAGEPASSQIWMKSSN